jgi:hypothetical protein
LPILENDWLSIGLETISHSPLSVNSDCIAAFGVKNDETRIKKAATDEAINLVPLGITAPLDRVIKYQRGS